MTHWDESLYGARIAGVYDGSVFGAAGDTDEAVEFLVVLAEESAGRTMLELGSGTGRLLIPLAERGYQVEGVELSPEMVARMREKSGNEIPVTVGDMVDFDLGRRFDIVFLAYNSLHCLSTQERQVACLRTAARHLSVDGVLVCEASLPYPLTRLPPKGVTTVSVGADEVVLIPYRHDQVGQVIESATVVIREDGIKIYPSCNRYAWPPELDLMAQLSGLRLRARYGDWTRTPFDALSDNHVCLYEFAERPVV